MKVIIATGGTGGHIFPAFAVLQDLKERGHQCLVLADKRFKKFKSQFPEGLNYKIIKSAGMSGSILKRFIGLITTFFGILQAIMILLKYKPNIVVSFGGYPSFPTMVAAKILKVPLLIHEPNSVVGQASSFFIKEPTIITTAFAKTKNIDKNNKRNYFTGTPVREQFLAYREKEYPAVKNKLTILVIGGSQGAKILSDIVPKAITELEKQYQKKIKIYQQTRPELASKVINLYNKHSIDATVSNFFDDMADKLAESHLVICRAGATTIAELTAVGRPSILVPIKNSKENHQLLNAQTLSKKEAGILIEEKDFTEQKLQQLLIDFIDNPKRLSVFAQQAKHLYKYPANKIVKLVEKYCTT